MFNTRELVKQIIVDLYCKILYGCWKKLREAPYLLIWNSFQDMLSEKCKVQKQYVWNATIRVQKGEGDVYI